MKTEHSEVSEEANTRISGCYAGAIDPALVKYYFRHSGLDPESSKINSSAPCALLDTGLRRYDGVTVYVPDQ